jgi:hypothetical protein
MFMGTLEVVHTLISKRGGWISGDRLTPSFFIAELSAAWNNSEAALVIRCLSCIHAPKLDSANPPPCGCPRSDPLNGEFHEEGILVWFGKGGCLPPLFAPTPR